MPFLGLHPAVSDRDVEGFLVLWYFRPLLLVSTVVQTHEEIAITFNIREMVFIIIHLSFALDVLNLSAVTNTGKNTDGRIGKYDVSREHGN